jgi:hypothetical protein
VVWVRDVAVCVREKGVWLCGRGRVWLCKSIRRVGTRETGGGDITDERVSNGDSPPQLPISLSGAIGHNG